MSTTYRVVIKGVKDGFTKEQVVSQLAPLFKVTEDQIRTSLDSSSFVVKKGIDLQSTEKYQTVLEQRGCVCAIEPEAEPVRPSVPPAAPESVSISPSVPPAATEPVNIKKENGRFCIECGEEITTEAKFCAKCGAKVDKFNTPPANSSLIPAPQSSNSIASVNVQSAKEILSGPIRKKSSTLIKIIGWGLAAAVTLIFIFASSGTPNTKEVFSQYAHTAGWNDAVYDSGTIIKEGYFGVKGSVSGEDKVYLYKFNYHDNGNAQEDYVLVINTNSGKTLMKWGTEQSLLDFMEFSSFHQ